MLELRYSSQCDHLGDRYIMKHSCRGHSRACDMSLGESSEEGILGKKTMGVYDRLQFSCLHSALTVRSALTLKPVLNLAFLWLKSSCVGVAIATAINHVWGYFISWQFLCNKTSVYVISRWFLRGQKLYLFCLPLCTRMVPGPQWKQRKYLLNK